MELANVLLASGADAPPVAVTSLAVANKQSPCCSAMGNSSDCCIARVRENAVALRNSSAAPRPVDHLAGAPIGRKHGIENMLDRPIAHHQGEALRGAARGRRAIAAALS